MPRVGNHNDGDEEDGGQHKEDRTPKENENNGRNGSASNQGPPKIFHRCPSLAAVLLPEAASVGGLIRLAAKSFLLTPHISCMRLNMSSAQPTPTSNEAYRPRLGNGQTSKIVLVLRRACPNWDGITCSPDLTLAKPIASRVARLKLASFTRRGTTHGLDCHGGYRRSGAKPSHGGVQPVGRFREPLPDRKPDLSARAHESTCAERHATSHGCAGEANSDRRRKLHGGAALASSCRAASL